MPRTDLRGPAEGDLSPRAIEDEHEIGQGKRRLDSVLDDDDRVPPLRRQCPEDLEDGGHAGRIEVRGRLIEDDATGKRGQDVGDGETLLFAARERLRQARLVAGQADLPQGPRHRVEHHGARPAAVLQPEGRLVLDAGHDELTLRILEDDPDPFAEASRRRARDLLLADREAPLPATPKGVRDDAREGARQRALARSRWAEHEQDRPGGKPERQAAQRRRGSAGVGPAEPAGDDLRRCNASAAPDHVPGGNDSSTPALRSARTRYQPPRPAMTVPEATMAMTIAVWKSRPNWSAGK